MKYYKRQKRKQLSKKLINDIITSMLIIYSNEEINPLKAKQIIKFIKLKNGYNDIGYKIYNVNKMITKEFKEYIEIYNILNKEQVNL